MSNDYLVTVCARCLRASCWHDEFPCDAARGAGTVDLRASDLRRAALEHQSHFSRKTLLLICGQVREAR